jgi:rfaE bifunctional protein nucleotidyltransferase chain/domain
MEKKIIWTNGCFDILHVGHIELFKYAKSMGFKLYVGVDSDDKVKSDKGEDRPFNKLSDRIKVLESIKYIDKVFSFDSTEGLKNLVKKHKPHVLIVGSDWKNKTVVGEEYAQQVRFFDRIEGYSTTNILEWK